MTKFKLLSAAAIAAISLSATAFAVETAVPTAPEELTNEMSKEELGKGVDKKDGHVTSTAPAAPSK